MPDQAATPVPGPVADPMMTDLLKSGLVPSDMAATVEPFAATNYRIPYYFPDGTVHPVMHRIKITQPLPGGGKYTQTPLTAIIAAGLPAHTATMPYLNPVMFANDPHAKSWAEYGARKGKLLTIVEGEKKATALFKFTGVHAVGIGGCWGALIHPDEHEPKKNPLPFILHPMIRALLQPGDRVEVVFDADIQTNPDVNRAAGTLRRVLKKLGIPTTFVLTPASGAGRAGIDDWLMGLAPGTQPSEYALLPRSDGFGLNEDSRTLWDALGLIMRGKEPLENEFNAHAVLTQHDYFAGRFRFDVQRMLLRWRPHEGGEEEVTPEAHAQEFVMLMQQRMGLAHWGTPIVARALAGLERDKSIHFNSVLEEWGCPAWDGTPRLKEMFLVGFNAKPALFQSIQYLHMVGENWLTSAMARLYDPGCQVDTMMILEGKQGIGKSSALRVLGGCGHVTVHGDITNKDFMLAAHRSWFADFDELGGMRMREVEQVKQIITTRVDTFRRPYGTSSVSYPRRFVMVGSTNNSDYLSSEDGKRRFWPIRCGDSINMDWLIENRAQLLAEAYHRYQAGMIWYDPGNLIATHAQAARMAPDEIEAEVRMFLEDTAGMATITRVVNGVKVRYYFVPGPELTNAVKSRYQGPVHAATIARIMSRIDEWEKYQYRNTTPVPVRSFTPGGITRMTCGVDGYTKPIPVAAAISPVVVPMHTKF